MKLLRVPFAAALLMLAACSSTVNGSPVAAPGVMAPSTAVDSQPGEPANDDSVPGSSPGSVPDSSPGTSPDEGLAEFRPSASDPDPSVRIEGIFVGESIHGDGQSATSGPLLTYPAYDQRIHVSPDDRVAYDRYPPIGGPHDGTWADCSGTAYATPVRNENMVHSMEHGALWIAYNPETLADGDLEKLAGRLTDYVMLSPYPGLDAPISLQYWAHQLQVDSADDPRIDQFLTALLGNAWVYPETGAPCDGYQFDTNNPPPLVPEPPGPGAMQMDGETR